MHDPSQIDQSDTETINVVPLADLTLVLLIILMVISPMISQSMIHVSTPAVKSDTALNQMEDTQRPPDPLVIAITNQGYTLNNVAAPDLNTLVQALFARIQEQPDRQVLVTADEDISVGKVVQVLDYAKLNGARNVSLLKKQSQTEEPS